MTGNFFIGSLTTGTAITLGSNGSSVVTGAVVSGNFFSGGAGMVAIDPIAVIGGSFGPNSTSTGVVHVGAFGLTTTGIQVNESGAMSYSASVVIGARTPNANSILDLTSTTKAFLPPRMATGNELAIASPVEGMQVFNTTSDQMEWYDGTRWGANFSNAIFRTVTPSSALSTYMVDRNTTNDIWGFTFQNSTGLKAGINAFNDTNTSNAGSLLFSVGDSSGVLVEALRLKFTKDAIFQGAVAVQNTAAKVYSGSGSPESVVTAAKGSLFMRTDGGAGTSLYVKESGAGNTGWVAK